MSVRILTGDCREQLATLPEKSVQMCVTSPPYFGLRNYDCDGQFGLEETPEEFVTNQVEVFRAVHRVLRDDGTLWLNIGDSYSGGGRGGNPGHSRHQKQRTNAGSVTVRNVKRSPFKDKDLIGIPWMLAFALRADGWYLRQDIIWSKPNPMPESVTDRCTKAHEYLFILSKSKRYYFNADAIMEGLAPASVARLGQDIEAQAGSERVPGKTNGTMRAVGGRRKRGTTAYHAQYETNHVNLDNVSRGEGRNKRSVWTVATQPYRDAHFATFPPALVEPCILAGSRPGDVVVDPFFGSGTTGMVADRLQRDCIGIDLNPGYVAMAERRIRADAKLFAEISA